MFVVGGNVDRSSPEGAAGIGSTRSGQFLWALFAGDGSLEWQHVFGTTGDDQVFGVATDSAGSLYVVGSTTGAFPGEVSGPGYDVLVAKFDADGSLLWVDQLEGGSQAEGYGIVVSAAGVFIDGTAYGALPDNSYAGGDDGFIARVTRPTAAGRGFDSSGDRATMRSCVVLHSHRTAAAYVTGYTDNDVKCSSERGPARLLCRTLRTRRHTVVGYTIRGRRRRHQHPVRVRHARVRRISREKAERRCRKGSSRSSMQTASKVWTWSLS